jgi:hypothetical protein
LSTSAEPALERDQHQRSLVKDLAEGVSNQAEVANRLWLALITVAGFALIPRISAQGTIPLPFGFGDVSPFWFNIVVFPILVVIAIAFSAAHVQQIRAQKRAQDVISALEISSADTLHPRDYFDFLRKPSLTHVASLAQVIRSRQQFFTPHRHLALWRRLLSTAWYGVLKLVSVLIYSLLPILALVYAWLRVPGTSGLVRWLAAGGSIVALVALVEVLLLDAKYAYDTMKKFYHDTIYR